MDGGRPASRRRARGRRITTGVGVLVLATLVVAGALVTGDVHVVGGAGVLALACGWVALRLAWDCVLQTRLAHATDRTVLAQAHQRLLAERASQHQVLVAEMSTRLTLRDRTIRNLQSSRAGIRRRALEAETTAWALRRRLADAERRADSMEALADRLAVRDPVDERPVQQA